MFLLPQLLFSCSFSYFVCLLLSPQFLLIPLFLALLLFFLLFLFISFVHATPPISFCSCSSQLIFFSSCSSLLNFFSSSYSFYFACSCSSSLISFLPLLLLPQLLVPPASPIPAAPSLVSPPALPCSTSFPPPISLILYAPAPLSSLPLSCYLLLPISSCIQGVQYWLSFLFQYFHF
jgi:hypothetical protein